MSKSIREILQEIVHLDMSMDEAEAAIRKHYLEMLPKEKKTNTHTVDGVTMTFTTTNNESVNFGWNEAIDEMRRRIVAEPKEG